VSAICAAAVGVGLTAELFRPAGSAAVADLPAQERVRAFGLLFWAANLGFTVSTVAAGILVQYGYGILSWINAAASVLAALIVWRHVPETRPPAAEEARRALLPVLLRDPLMLAMAAIHVVYFAMLIQCPLRAAVSVLTPGRRSSIFHSVPRDGTPWNECRSVPGPCGAILTCGPTSLGSPFSGADAG
jgi:MFS family permease